MRHCLTIFAVCWIASCTAPVEYVYVTPDVPAELRTPVDVPERKAETLSDVGVILADHVQALDTANGKIIATDCILASAEKGRAVAPLKCLPETEPKG